MGNITGNIPNSAYLVKQKRGKDVTPATVGKINKNGIQVEPESTLVSAYTVRQKRHRGKNKATIGAISPEFVSACQGINPASTSPKKYVKKTK